jgi:hypothetical protein
MHLILLRFLWILLAAPSLVPQSAFSEENTEPASTSATSDAADLSGDDKTDDPSTAKTDKPSPPSETVPMDQTSILGRLDNLYDPQKPFYQKSWSESYFSVYSLDGLDSDIYRYMFRKNFPVWKMIAIGLGFDFSYFDVEKDILARPDPLTGTMVGAKIESRYAALGIGGRLQSGFDMGILNISPYIDYNADLIAKSHLTIEGDDEHEDGKLEDGGKNKRLEMGINLYLDLGDWSFGVGMESGTLNGDFGSSVKLNGFHLSIRRL